MARKSEFYKGKRKRRNYALIPFVIVLALIALALILFGYFDIRICQQAGGFIGSIRYGVYALGIILFIGLVYLFPTMAAFSDTLLNLFRKDSEKWPELLILLW